MPECIEAVRILQVAGDPPPGVQVGLSNVSNAVPNEMRPLINRVYCVMLMGAGLDTMIGDPLDHQQNQFIRIVEQRDSSTSLGQLLLHLHDAVAAGEELSQDAVDLVTLTNWPSGNGSDPAEQSDIRRFISAGVDDRSLLALRKPLIVPQKPKRRCCMDIPQEAT